MTGRGNGPACRSVDTPERELQARRVGKLVVPAADIHNHMVACIIAGVAYTIDTHSSGVSGQIVGDGVARTMDCYAK